MFLQYNKKKILRKKMKLNNYKIGLSTLVGRVPTSPPTNTFFLNIAPKNGLSFGSFVKYHTNVSH